MNPTAYKNGNHTEKISIQISLNTKLWLYFFRVYILKVKNSSELLNLLSGLTMNNDIRILNFF